VTSAFLTFTATIGLLLLNKTAYVCLLSGVLHCCELFAAADVLDQFNVVAPGTTSIGGLVIDDRFAPGQTVRVGRSSILSRIELGLYRQTEVTSPLFVDIVRTVNGQPSFAADDRLATRTLNQAQIPFLTAFPEIGTPTYTVSVDYLAFGMLFNEGDSFGIVLRSSAPQFRSYSWWVAQFPTNTYPAGGAWSLQYETNRVLSQGGIDTQFATYVLVPEPSTCCLSLAAVGVALRRRRRQSVK
jgi:hypothetical protein